MQNQDRLATGAVAIVRIAQVANRAFMLAVALGLTLSLILSTQFAGIVSESLPGTDVPSAMTGMRLLMLLGVAMSVATEILLVTLGAITTSASAGDPFIAVNAQRLQKIGWCLFVLQLFEVPGALIARYFPSMGPAAPSGDFSIGGWIAVLMVFVLARVFAAGSAMRDDLEGTI